MNSHPPAIEDIHNRLLRLEKQDRRLKQLGIALLIVPGLLLVMGQAPSRKTIEANEFLLKDANGRVRARLQIGVGDFYGVPELELIDEKGTTMVQLHGGRSCQL